MPVGAVSVVSVDVIVGAVVIVGMLAELTAVAEPVHPTKATSMRGSSQAQMHRVGA